MANKPIELLLDRRGKLSRTALMFLIWMTFIMVLIGHVTFTSNPKKIADLPEAYVYITLVLAGTYTARRFLDNKPGGVDNPTPPPVVTPPVITPPVVVNPPVVTPPVITPPTDGQGVSIP